MYSVVEIAGHQYRVKAGDLIDVQKLSDEVGTEVTLDKVLFVGGDKTAVGTPVVEGATVKAKIIKTDRARKIIVFKRIDVTLLRKQIMWWKINSNYF